MKRMVTILLTLIMIGGCSLAQVKQTQDVMSVSQTTIDSMCVGIEAACTTSQTALCKTIAATCGAVDATIDTGRVMVKALDNSTALPDVALHGTLSAITAYEKLCAAALI